MNKKNTCFLKDQKGQASVEFMLFVVFIFFILFIGFIHLGYIVLNKQRIEIANYYLIHTSTSAKTSDRESSVESKALAMLEKGNPPMIKTNYIINNNRVESPQFRINSENNDFKKSQIDSVFKLSPIMQTILNKNSPYFFMSSSEIWIKGPRYK